MITEQIPYKKYKQKSRPKQKELKVTKTIEKTTAKRKNSLPSYLMYLGIVGISSWLFFMNGDMPEIRSQVIASYVIIMSVFVLRLADTKNN